MQRSIFLLIFILTNFSTIFAQQNYILRGRIKDNKNQQPLFGASVHAAGKAAISDENGYYQIGEIDKKNITIAVSYIGYQNKQINYEATSDFANVDFFLDEEVSLINTVTITTGKYDKPLGEVTVSLDVLKPSLLKSINAVSVDKALDKLPGINILDGQANIRGGSGFSYGAGSRVLMLLDDIPVLQPDAGLVNWEDLSVENVNQVEVLKGAASALYGSSAMNGIINLRTGYAKSTPETEAAIFTTVWGTPQNEVMQWWGRDTSEIQQPLQSGFSFVHRRKEKKLDVVLSAYALYRDSYNRNSFSRYGRISPNLRYRIHDRLTVGLNTNFNFGRSGSFFLWGNDTNLAMQPGMNSATQSKGRLRFTVDPTINYFDKNGNQHKFLSRVYYIQNNNDNNQSNQSQNYYGEYQFQRKFQKSNIVITAGMVGVYNHTKAKLYSDGAFSLTNYATYLQLDKKFFERLNVSAGLRYEGYLLKSPTYVDGDTIPNGTTKEGKPVMRIGANYQLSQATYLRASWGQGYRFPTIAEKFITTNFGVASVVPNAKLFSETGWSAEFGVKQGFKIREWQGFADAAFFWSEYNNMMEFNFLLLPPPRLVGFQSQNIGNTKITGVEFSIVGQGSVFNIPLSLMTGYTKIDPTFRSFTAVEDSLSSASYNVLKYRFRHSFKFDAEAKFVNEKLSVGTNIVYNSFMEAIDAVFGVFITGLQDWRTRNNHGVTIVDVRAGYQFTPRWKASFICSNLTNKEYSVRPALLEAPRGYTLRLDYSLK